MVRCEACGKDVPEGKRFCISCGAVLTPPPIYSATVAPEGLEEKPAGLVTWSKKIPLIKNPQPGLYRGFSSAEFNVSKRCRAPCDVAGEQYARVGRGAVCIRIPQRAEYCFPVEIPDKSRSSLLYRPEFLRNPFYG